MSELVEETGRPFDVGEEERDRPRREAGSAHGSDYSGEGAATRRRHEQAHRPATEGRVGLGVTSGKLSASPDVLPNRLEHVGKGVEGARRARINRSTKPIQVRRASRTHPGGRRFESDELHERPANPSFLFSGGDYEEPGPRRPRPIPPPAPNPDYPDVGAFFGNTDIFGGSYVDPSGR